MPRKRPRTEDTGQRPKLATSAKLNLLSLPDEPLSLILLHLGASQTRGSFQRPRHAFALAQANSRLLRLFANLVTHITPDTANPTPPALSPRHLLSVACLAGHALRELHLPDGCFDILPLVAHACPRLEALSVVDNPLCCKAGLNEALRLLSLRSLSITNPSFQCFRSLASPPPELTLTNVLYLCLLELIPILRDPPRKLHLMVDYKGFTVKPWLTKLLVALVEAIPKMESLSLEMPFCYWHPREAFADEAEHLIAAARQNNAESKCMSIKLEGDGIFQLLKSVNPNATIEISRWGQTFADYGDGFHARKLVIGEKYLMTDVSRLREVIVADNCNPRWKAALSGVKFDRVAAYDLHAAACMDISFDTIEIYISHCRGKQWGWLASSREVRIVGAVGHVPIAAWFLFFEALESLLQQYQGEVVWITDISMSRFNPAHCEMIRFRHAVRAVRTAIERFEERNGDAGTVKSLVDNILMLDATVS